MCQPVSPSPSMVWVPPKQKKRKRMVKITVISVSEGRTRTIGCTGSATRLSPGRITVLSITNPIPFLNRRSFLTAPTSDFGFDVTHFGDAPAVVAKLHVIDAQRDAGLFGVGLRDAHHGALAV